LDENKYLKPILVNTLELEIVDGEAVAQVVLREISRFCNSGDYKNFRFL